MAHKFLHTPIGTTTVGAAITKNMSEKQDNNKSASALPGEMHKTGAVSEVKSPGKKESKSPIKLKPSAKFASPAKKQAAKKGASNEVFGTEISGGVVHLYEIETTNGQPSYLKNMRDMVAALQADENVKLVCFTNVYDENGKMKKNADKYPSQALLCVQDATGEDLNSASTLQGGAIAGAYVKHTRPYSDKKRNIVGGPVTCAWAFNRSSHARILNKAVGTRGACKVVAIMYHEYLVNGTFWEHADDIISTFFEDANEDVVKKTIKFEHEKNLEG